MANNKVKHYRTDVAGRKPEAKNMLDGEIAINLADKKIFTKFGDAVINIGNGADAVVEGGQTFTDKIKASDIESDSNLTLKNLDKSDIVFADEHGKAKSRISSPAQTDAKGELRVTVAKGKATGENSDFVLNGNGQLSLPASPVAPDSATRKDYVDSEISKVQTGSSADLTKLEQKVDDNDAAINTRVDNLNSKVDQNDTAINTKVDQNDTAINTKVDNLNSKVDANKADADSKIKAVNDRLTVDNQTLTDMINAKVSKSGDTMTGKLTVPDIKTNKIVISTTTETNLGDNSITLGDSDTGLKWVKDGHIQFWTDYQSAFDIDKGQTLFNRPVTLRHRNNNNVDDPVLDRTAFLTIETNRDGGSNPSYLGHFENGRMSHYLRGKGQTHILTESGMTVAGESYIQNQMNFNTPYGVYDINSMPTWSGAEQQINYLRRTRAHNSAVWWHETVIANHEDPRLTNSISWFTGGGRDVWLQSMKHNGDMNFAGRLSVYGDGNAIQLNSKSDSSSYIAGNLDGRTNAWIVGKTDANNALVIENNMYNDVGKKTTLIFGDAQLHTTVGGNSILKAYNNRLEVDGTRWAATNSHALTDQWKQPSPISINMGSVPGNSDYYPAIEQRSVASGAGMNTTVQLGTLREANGYGKGIIRVGEHSFEPGRAKHATYSFDIEGKFTSGRILATDKILVGGGTGAGLAGPSITLGDSDTGFKQSGDGVLESYSNSKRTWQATSTQVYFDVPISAAKVTDRSDIRLKSNLEVIPDALSKVSQLTGYTYDIKRRPEDEESVRDAGLIAQDIQKVLPEAVITDTATDMLSVCSASVNSLLVNAIKELSADLKETKARLAELEAK